MGSEVFEIVYLVIYSQVVLVPILGLLFLGLRAENARKERLLQESLRALRVVGISKGRHLK